MPCGGLLNLDLSEAYIFLNRRSRSIPRFRLGQFGFNRIDNLAVVNRIFKMIGLLSETGFAFYSVLKEGEECC